MVVSTNFDSAVTESFVEITPGPSLASSQPFEGQFQNPADQQAFLAQQLTLDEFVSNAGDLVDAAGSGLLDPHLLSGLDFPFNWGFPEEGINCNFMTGPSNLMEGQAETPLPSGVGATTPAVGPSWSSKTSACSIPVAEQQDDQEILLAEDFSHVTPLSEAAYERVKHLFENLTIDRTENVKLALPSAAGLNALIQLAFEYFIRSFPIIHPATFDPNTVPEHVVVAVAAVGVNYTASFRKDEYRKSFMRFLEGNLQTQLPRKPSSKIDISILECLVLYNMCLMFSGSHRDLLKLQYARNILPTLYRQVRILGKCTGMQDGRISPEGANEESWKAWIARERERRAMHGIWGKSNNGQVWARCAE
ncbi:Transcription factor fungi [Macrophomina phaseolina MS6]|uniref:Transcription factor fungi n=1 Tax=Macrophomina phaseolina (strain MS6) TaxID=1126212 RepID=K2SHA9_MACPH|nr:Transcription factor fungi [Macrophomina phaseolina MS6]